MEYNFAAIGQKIRKMRKEQGWSQEAFIGKLRDVYLPISRNTIVKIEKGDQNAFTLDFLIASCKVFGCDIGYLMGEYGDCKTRDNQFIFEQTGLSECSILSIQAMKNSFSLRDERISLINYFLSHITATLNLTSSIIDYGEKLTSYQNEAKQYYQEYNKFLFQSFRGSFQCTDESDLNIPRSDTGKIKAPHGGDSDGRRIQQMSDSCDAAMFKAQTVFNQILDMIAKDICSECEKTKNSDGQD